MATSTELARVQTVTKDGVITATTLDVISPDRMVLSLIRGSAAARYGRVADDTPLVSRDIKDLLIFPFTRL